MVFIKSNNKKLEIPNLTDAQLRSLNFCFPKDRQYSMGIDQSTTCTGIYIEDVTEDFSAILEIPRDKVMSKTQYFSELTKFLNYMFKDRELTTVVYERPIPNMKQSVAYKTLTELAGKLEQWLYDNPAMTKVKTMSLYPQSWKSKVMDKSKGSGRTSNKMAIAEDICDAKPHLKEFFRLTQAKDLDAYDACGILMGYKKLCFVDGWPCIFGYLEKRHVTEVFYRYVSESEFQENMKETMYGVFNGAAFIFKPKFKVYNDDYDLNRNYRMASSNDNFVVTYLPKSAVQRLQWKFDFNAEPGNMMLAYIVRKNAYKPNEIKFLEAIMPWHEEIEHVE